MAKKRPGTKTVILWISLIPYAVFLVWGIILFIKNIVTNWHGYLEFFPIVEPIGDFWVDAVIVQGNILAIALAIFSVGYPVYYLIDRRIQSGKPSVMVGDTSSPDGRKCTRFFVLYTLLYAVYLTIPYYGFKGMEVGLFGTSSIGYGWDAMFWVIACGIVIPVFPALLLFDIIYTVKCWKTWQSWQKNLIIGIICGILAISIIAIVIHP